MRRALIAMGLVLWAGQLTAQTASERPVARPDALSTVREAPKPSTQALSRSERPVARPDRTAQTSSADASDAGDPSRDPALSRAGLWMCASSRPVR